MTVTESIPTDSIQYPHRTIKRAERAVCCSPLQLQLFVAMCWQGVDLKAIANELGVRNHYTRRPLTELTAESELLWLIQVGVLRREVDGQGLTDSFRLTPLGRQLLDRWQTRGSGLPKPSPLDHIYNALNRWLRLPGWLQ
ncbi:MAG: hypothetical protein F6K19_27325 [Cyanothece sp. SIO1E1]|nr:hypothetical protein [Cyanothece sp. SIO1E1]